MTESVLLAGGVIKFRRRRPLNKTTKSNRGMEMKERRLVSSSLDSSWHTVPANRVVGAGGSERPFKPLDRARERSAHHLGFAQVSQVLVPSRLQSWRIQNEKIDEPGNTGHTATAGETPSSLLAQSLCLRLRFPQPHKNPIAARTRLQKTVRQHMLSPCVYQFRQPRTDAHAQRRSRERIVPFCRHDWCSQVLKVPREGYLRNDSHSALPLISTITNQRTFASEPNTRRSMVGGRRFRNNTTTQNLQHLLLQLCRSERSIVRCMQSCSRQSFPRLSWLGDLPAKLLRDCCYCRPTRPCE